MNIKEPSLIEVLESAYIRVDRLTNQINELRTLRTSLANPTPFQLDGIARDMKATKTSLRLVRNEIAKLSDISKLLNEHSCNSI